MVEQEGAKAVEGGCHCGGVTFRLHGALRPVIACHCTQCRMLSGHYIAATQLERAGLEILTSDTLEWYSASGAAKRGFCRTCGVPLFWQPREGDRISVFTGALKSPTGLKLAGHIFAGDKGDYYEIAEDGTPAFQGDWEGEKP